jgi:hypothetical protein
MSYKSTNGYGQYIYINSPVGSSRKSNNSISELSNSTYVSPIQSEKPTRNKSSYIFKFSPDPTPKKIKKKSSKRSKKQKSDGLKKSKRKSSKRKSSKRN